MRAQRTQREDQRPLDIAIIIVSWNVRHFLSACVQSVQADLAHAQLNGAIWVIDNASADGSADLIASAFNDVHLIANSDNRGFGAANNQGITAAMQHDPRYVFLLNPDTVVQTGALGRLVSFMDNNLHVGMAGCKLLNADGTLQHSAFRFPGIGQLLFEFYPLPARLYNTMLNGRYPAQWYAQFTPFEIDHPLGAAMLLRQDAVRATNGFDQAFHIYCEEIDWAWRVQKAGWRVAAVPSAEITHFGGESTGQVRAQSVINLWKSRAQLYNRWVNPLKRHVAKQIVRHGLARLAAEAESAELQAAYRQAASYWQA